MNKPQKLRDQPKRGVHVVREADGWVVRRSADGAYRDRDSGRVGFGATYGERSYNNRPVHADPVERAGDGAMKVPFGPFDAPTPNRRHVSPDGPNRWVVTQPGKGTPNSVHRTEGAAERAAKAELKHSGGQVVVHRPDGTIRDADTVPPASDPFPPRDKSH
jgi:hypothetical protein